MNSDTARLYKRFRFSQLSTLAQAGILLSSLTVSDLHADSITLPAATAETIIATQGQGSDCQIKTSLIASCAIGGASAGAEITNGGSVEAYAGTNVTLGAEGFTSYSIAVTGSGTSQLVPIVIRGSATVSFESTETSIGEVSIGIEDSTLGTSVLTQYFSDSVGCSEIDSSIRGAPCTAPGSFYTLDASLIPGDVYVVGLVAKAGGGDSQFATIDPSIEIDPSFADANDYSLIASAGVFPSTTPPSTAPEPGTVGLLAIGIVVAANAIRRARQTDI